MSLRKSWDIRSTEEINCVSTYPAWGRILREKNQSMTYKEKKTNGLHQTKGLLGFEDESQATNRILQITALIKDLSKNV